MILFFRRIIKLDVCRAHKSAISSYQLSRSAFSAVTCLLITVKYVNLLCASHITETTKTAWRAPLP